jgi:hypothetical protein
MNKSFKLTLQRVECTDEQSGEWGNDEMYLVGFGVTKSGQRFSIPPMSLGSFATGDINGSDYPRTLVDILVPDPETLVSTCIWLFERDSGGLASSGDELAAAFDRQMIDNLRETALLGLSPDAHQFYSFAMSMVTMSRFTLEGAASSVINDDDLLQHLFKDHVPVLGGRFGDNTYALGFGPDGLYTLTFAYVLDEPELVLHE